MSLKQFIWLNANICRRNYDNIILFNSTLFVPPKNKRFTIIFPGLLLQDYYNLSKLLN